MKVELTKKWRKFKKGDVVDVTRDLAKELIKQRTAKDLTIKIEEDGK